jgi:DNA protecting protein DprA
LSMVAIAPSRRQSSRYRPPPDATSIRLQELLAKTGRQTLEDRQFDFLGSEGSLARVYYAGSLELLIRPSVSIVGTREVSDAGAARARRVARELAAAGIVVVSGLAKGVDTAALTSAIDSGGSTVAVIGTPLDKAYPAENAALQEKIYEEHLLLTPFRTGERTFKGNFPKRNRVMAAISDATVIVEASDTSGTLHQAAECGRLGRWLFIMKSILDDNRVSWPHDFIGKPKVAVLNSSQDVIDAIRRERA